MERNFISLKKELIANNYTENFTIENFDLVKHLFIDILKLKEILNKKTNHKNNNYSSNTSISVKYNNHNNRNFDNDFNSDYLQNKSCNEFLDLNSCQEEYHPCISLYKNNYHKSDSRSHLNKSMNECMYTRGYQMESQNKFLNKNDEKCRTEIPSLLNSNKILYKNMSMNNPNNSNAIIYNTKLNNDIEILSNKIKALNDNFYFVKVTEEHIRKNYKEQEKKLKDYKILNNKLAKEIQVLNEKNKYLTKENGNLLNKTRNKNFINKISHTKEDSKDIGYVDQKEILYTENLNHENQLLEKNELYQDINSYNYITNIQNDTNDSSKYIYNNTNQINQLDDINFRNNNKNLQKALNDMKEMYNLLEEKFNNLEKENKVALKKIKIYEKLLKNI